MSEETKMYSQQEIDNVVEERLKRQKDQHKAELDGYVKQFKTILGKDENGSTVTAELVQQALKTNTEQLEAQSLRTLFGSTSDGAAANRLAMSDPAKYREMKRRAEKLGVIQGAPVPEDTPDTSKFTRRDTAYFDGINKVLNRNVKK